MKICRMGISILLFALIIQWTVPASAKKAYISDIVVTNNRDDLLVYFSVNDCFTVEMNRAIESGLKTTFTFFVELYERSDFWWDRKISGVEIFHSIKYDSLKRVYELTLSENGHGVVTVKDFDEAKKLMSEIVALKLAHVHDLQKGGRYQVQIMAELDKIKLPFYLHHVLFFLSLWDFKTDWYTVNFTY